MKKLVVAGAGAAIAFGAAGLFGAGIAAAAPDVVGQTYEDAASAIEDDGGEPKVAVTVGSKLSQDECVVTNAWDAPFVRDAGDEYEHADGEVMLSLNCDGGYASATNPGASLASPAGREAKAAADEAAAAEEEELAEASTPDE
ncbi:MULTISPECIES: hypothetical protein [Mycolicibacterium]|uniref:DUF732 domain-containing protein n=1 Tax=Mycolicibacterium wolinskyi TaxID=59750 RepID=A0A132PQS8_9MYCO|nr:MULTISPECIES: hypothetical protein [Mycolicibacterium]KWX24691.1 hypothetical protein AFM11_08460 [Mycolicibacterium wolinskyi]MCV7283921.1 hypothetical protein [Mycolicibacterium wolinskyi]MCV7297543.1 hypothetical protein [Mycolicibacterium goodii]ORX19337.1 hypothetical protein AWC31_00315 [Mycolicibacterium wolinskyi]